MHRVLPNPQPLMLNVVGGPRNDSETMNKPYMILQPVKSKLCCPSPSLCVCVCVEESSQEALDESQASGSSQFGLGLWLVPAQEIGACWVQSSGLGRVLGLKVSRLLSHRACLPSRISEFLRVQI